MDKLNLRPTPRYTEVIQNAADAAVELGHKHIGVEHLFLAIARDHRAVPSQVLARHVNIGAVVEDLLRLMDSPGYNTPTENVVIP